MDISNDIVQKTQKTLGKYVKKPPLTEKLLKKPPFRFLHDVIKTVIKETGFLGNLFSENELDNEHVKEKDAKIAFLTKLIDAIKSVSDTQLAVRPSKIVAGLEPAETNKLLQAIARAIETNADISGFVNKIKNAENGNKIQTKKSTETINNKKSLSQTKLDSDRTSKKTSETKIKLKRSSSKDSDTKLTDRKRESSRDKKSKESAKLTDRRESSKDKKNKEEINRTKTSTKEKSKRPETRPTEKGEPEQVLKNNETARKDASDGSIVKNEVNEHVELSQKENYKKRVVEGVKQHEKFRKNVLSSNDHDTEVGESNNDNIDDNIIRQHEAAEIKKDITSEVNHAVMARQPSASLIRPKSAKIKPPSSASLKPDHHNQKPSDTPQPGINEQINQKSSSRPKSSLRPPSVRPSSARPGAPRLRPESALPVSETVTMGNINVIVENFDNADDEETVVIQNNVDALDESGGNDVAGSGMPLGALMESGENKGQLVEQILEQIQESEGDKKWIHQVDWEPDANTKEATTKDINQLRAQIQALTKTANPLGKLLNYLHEDLEAMHNELQMWTKTKKQLYAEIEKQKKINAEQSKPLLAQLKQMQLEIKKYEHEIMAVKSNILKNDLRIKELVSK